MDNNIVSVKLDSRYASTRGVWQYDYGQVLRITGPELPPAVEVQFSLAEKSGETLSRVGTTVDGVTEVKIPDELLTHSATSNYRIYAYIYLTDETSGNTKYEITIPVRVRSKPTSPAEDPETDPDLFRETVVAVNASAERAKMAEQNAKESATEAGKYAASASESAVTAEKTKEDALRKVGEKKQEAIEAIQNQEETSVGKITTHTDGEIQRIQNQVAESKGELEQTIINAGVSEEELDESIQTASDTKTALDKSVELAGTAKTELDTSIREAGTAKTALNESTETAGTVQETLSATVKQAGALDTSLGENIEIGTQLKTDLTASGEKAVQDIQAAGSEQLGKMQAVAEEFTADREQINVNKEDISILKEEMGKNFLDDAKTKRSLDALWKLNQGISYQFETDAEKAYQKDIPSGAKLVSVKKIGGRTIVWNQMLKLLDSSNWTARGTAGSIEIADGECIVRDCASTWGGAVIAENLKILQTHKYYISLYGRVLNNGDSITIAVAETFPVTEIGVINSTTAYRVSKIVETSESLEAKFAFGNRKNTYDYAVSNFMLIDLTKMFGEGNEPSTPEEFEALFPEDYYPYNEGTLMSIPVNEVVEKGRNLFDEKMELGLMNYDVNSENFGENIASQNQLRASNYIPVEPNTQYFLRSDKAIAFIYDAKRKPIKIGSNGFLSMGRLFTTPSNARYLKFYLTKEYGIIYNSDLILTKGAITAYSPYHKNTYPITQAILDLDGYGDGVSDDVYNYVDWENKEYHKRVGKYTIDGSENIVKEKSYWLMTVTDFEKPRPSTINAICVNFKAGNKCASKWGNVIFRTGSNGFVFTDSESKFANANEVKDYFQQNNETIYYELAEEQIIDISDIIDTTFQEPIEVEAGGTLTFHNSNGDGYRLPVPNEEEYIVSLAEVGGGASE